MTRLSTGGAPGTAMIIQLTRVFNRKGEKGAEIAVKCGNNGTSTTFKRLWRSTIAGAKRRAGDRTKVLLPPRMQTESANCLERGVDALASTPAVVVDQPGERATAGDPSKHRVEVSGKFFTRGGQQLYLKGVSYGPFRPDPDGSLYHTRDIVARDFAAMAVAGINCVRVYTIPPRWLLDEAADQVMRCLHRSGVVVGSSIETFTAATATDKKAAFGRRFFIDHNFLEHMIEVLRGGLSISNLKLQCLPHF